MKRFQLHSGVLADLMEICDFVAFDRPDAAESLLAEFWRVFDLIGTSPGIGFRRAQYTSLPIRFYVVRRYLVAYLTRQEGVEIIAVFHGQRNPRVIAALLRGRDGVL